MSDLPFTRGQPDEQLTIVGETHRRRGQHRAQAVRYELCPSITPHRDSAVRGTEIDSDDHAGTSVLWLVCGKDSVFTANILTACSRSLADGAARVRAPGPAEPRSGTARHNPSRRTKSPARKCRLRRGVRPTDARRED